MNTLILILDFWIIGILIVWSDHFCFKKGKESIKASFTINRFLCCSSGIKHVSIRCVAWHLMSNLDQVSYWIWTIHWNNQKNVQLFLFITQTHHVTLDVFCSLTDVLSLFQTPGGQAKRKQWINWRWIASWMCQAFKVIKKSPPVVPCFSSARTGVFREPVI